MIDPKRLIDHGGVITSYSIHYTKLYDYKAVDLFKPNFKEFKEGVGAKLDKKDIPAILAEAEKLKIEKQFGIIFITLAEQGVLISNGVSQNHFPAEVRDIADVSGAGDTVIATASLCLAAVITSYSIHYTKLYDGA